MVTPMTHQPGHGRARLVAPAYAANWRLAAVTPGFDGTTRPFGDMCSLTVTGTNGAEGMHEPTIKRSARHLGRGST